jgi:hypothetical protein
MDYDGSVGMGEHEGSEEEGMATSMMELEQRSCEEDDEMDQASGDGRADDEGDNSSGGDGDLGGSDDEPEPKVLRDSDIYSQVGDDDPEFDYWKGFDEQEELEAQLSDEDALREFEEMMGDEEYAELWSTRWCPIHCPSLSFVQ